jgi:hypothetical protein
MKIIGIAVVRTGASLNEPIPLTVANDLSSFGFFQRQVGTMGRVLRGVGVFLSLCNVSFPLSLNPIVRSSSLTVSHFNPLFYFHSRIPILYYYYVMIVMLL